MKCTTISKCVIKEIYFKFVKKNNIVTAKDLLKKKCNMLLGKEQTTTY